MKKERPVQKGPDAVKERDHGALGHALCPSKETSQFTQCTHTPDGESSGEDSDAALTPGRQRGAGAVLQTRPSSRGS